MTIDCDLAFTWIVEAWQQIDDGRLTRTGRAEQSNGLPGVCSDRNSLQHRFAAAKITKRDVFKLYRASDIRQCDRIRLIGNIILGVENFKDAIGGGSGLSHLRDDESELCNREEQID